MSKSSGGGASGSGGRARETLGQTVERLRASARVLGREKGTALFAAANTLTAAGNMRYRDGTFVISDLESKISSGFTERKGRNIINPKTGQELNLHTKNIMDVFDALIIARNK